MDVNLQKLREHIDAVDDELVRLLNERAKLALEVGEWKLANNQPVFRPERELQIIERIQQRSSGPLHQQHLAIIWRELMSACRSLEQPSKVAFLGPEGTYTEEAAIKYFGESSTRIDCKSLDEVFRATSVDASMFGLAPIENSSEGAVARTMDLFLQYEIGVCGEVQLPIKHCLMSQASSLAEIKVVCAHAQALAQCQHWLNENLNHAERKSMTSNAQAVRFCAEHKDHAAIASAHAASIYQVPLLRTHIQDDVHNRTRFYVLGSIRPNPTGRDKTSLILSVPNRAGAVFDMLRPLAEHGVSMLRFESRPARSSQWEYYFYIDLEGHRNDANVAQALEALEHSCKYFRNLGSYPAGML